LQQVASSHAPVPWATKQLPAVGEPHCPGVPGQAKPANCVQVKSHETLQQNGSKAHTAAQQVAESQFGFVCGV
jgi:hypothetical protein